MSDDRIFAGPLDDWRPIAPPRDVLMARGLRNIAAEIAGQVLHDPTHVKALRAYADDLHDVHSAELPGRAA